MLFAAIFITIGPVIDDAAGGHGRPAGAAAAAYAGAAGQPRPLAYFWLTGLLSAFLDNAPTYLVFFELAGIRPAALSGGAGVVLAAISAGAVFFGGLTYIGNAPNMMLRAIAAHRGVRMPGFFGFMLLSSALLLPVLALGRRGVLRVVTGVARNEATRGATRSECAAISCWQGRTGGRLLRRP